MSPTGAGACVKCGNGEYEDLVSDPSICVNTCGDGFFADDYTATCRACGVSNCKECTNDSDCQTCMDTYYFDGTSEQCTACVDGCDTCTSTNDCS